MRTTPGFGPGGMHTRAWAASHCHPKTVCEHCQATNHDSCDGTAWTVEGMADGCVCWADNHREVGA